MKFQSAIATEDVAQALVCSFFSNVLSVEGTQLTLTYPLEMAIVSTGIPVPEEFDDYLEKCCKLAFHAMNADQKQAEENFAATIATDKERVSEIRAAQAAFDDYDFESLELEGELTMRANQMMDAMGRHGKLRAKWIGEYVTKNLAKRREVESQLFDDTSVVDWREGVKEGGASGGEKLAAGVWDAEATGLSMGNDGSGRR
jgi:hypothetical protein